MKLVINKDRSIIPVGTWGTVNENNYEILDFEFPAELEEYNKRIVYYLDDERVWDAIVNNKAVITNAITTKGSVKAYIWCTKADSQYETDVDFRTQLFEMNFYENENADGIVPTEEQVDGFNTMLTAMNAKIDEVDALEQTIGAAETERQENENARISNENTRESNESTRQENEETRQTQEADRERRTNEAIGNIEDKTAEYNQNAEEKTEAFNTNASQKTNDFNSNYTQKVNDFNTNATTQTSEFNSNASSKTSDFNSNAETKTNAFNTNATNKTNAFNSNATEKTTTFNDNASTKISEFNTNAESKTSAFNDNATQKTTNFDNNASEKTDEFNTNAQNKIDEYDEHIVEYQEQIDELQEEVEELSENMPWNTTEQATEINVDDAAKYSKNKLELFGNTEQDNTKMTYKCDGTETGDYYLTYNSIDYYFTMPTIVNGDILVFNTTDLKLYLGNTEITTESTGTGTNLTFISSPNPNYPQDIHVVTGNNSIGVQGKNLFDKNNSNIKSLNAGFPYEGTFSAATNQKHVYIKCKPNTYYVISKNFTKDWTQGIYETQVPPNVGVHAKRLYWGGFNPPVRVKTSDNANYLDVRLNTGAETTETINRILDGLQIEEGSTATDYAPYHYADYPIDLRGKNKFDITKITPNTYIGNNGATGTSTATNLSDYIYVQGNKEYTLSYKCDDFKSPSNRSLVSYTSNKQYVSGVYYNPTSKLFTFTPAQDGYIRFGYDINCYDIQVEEGDATEYEPYNSLELCKIGNYQDYLYKENGNWYKKNILNKYIFSGNENISKAAKDVFYTNDIANNILTSGIICLCNRLKAVANTSAGSSVPVNSCCFRPGDYSRFYFNLSSVTTDINEIKQYLSNNTTSVIYPLATPTSTQITDETLIAQLDAIYNHLALVKGTNHITITPSDLAPYMKLNYMQDLPSKLDNLDSRLALLE